MMKNDYLTKALQYVKDNVDYVDVEHAIHHMEEGNYPLRMVDDGLASRIYDLMDEYGIDNDLPDGWLDEYDEDDLIYKLFDIIWPSCDDGVDVDGLIAAPLNQKDIMEDVLFEQILEDFQDHVERDGQVLGWIDDIPVMIEWSFNSNQIIVTPMIIKENPSYTANIIKRRLKAYNNDETCETLCKTHVCYAIESYPVKVYASYYYKREE